MAVNTDPNAGVGEGGTYTPPAPVEPTAANTQPKWITWVIAGVVVGVAAVGLFFILK